MRDDKIIAIIDAIYTEMYAKATPSADFAELKKKYGGTDYDVFRDHVLSFDEQEEIIKRHCNNKRLRDFEKKQIRNSVLLGCAPIYKKNEEKDTEKGTC